MLIKMILSKIHFCCKIWMAKNCKNHRFRQVFVTFLHYKFKMANITAVGHISNFIFCSLDMCPNSISYTKNYQNLSHGLCHPLPGFSMNSLLIRLRHDCVTGPKYNDLYYTNIYIYICIIMPSVKFRDIACFSFMLGTFKVSKSTTLNLIVLYL